jgi:hypothetical protein
MHKVSFEVTVKGQRARVTFSFKQPWEARLMQWLLDRRVR